MMCIAGVAPSCETGAAPASEAELVSLDELAAPVVAVVSPVDGAVEVEVAPVLEPELVAVSDDVVDCVL
jgi:hypothetical protein